MSKRTLVEQLEYWRAERPDEWTMDDFIRDAKKEAARIADLERQLAAAQPTAQPAEDARDAARYRWLRNNAAQQFEHPIVVSQHQEVGNSMRYMGPVIDRELDRLIDVALQAGKEKEHGN